MKQSKILTYVLLITTILFIISFSIAVPIIFRPFYYLHIYLLNLPAKTGFDSATIIDAYDKMMDFCIGKSSVFSTGALKFSQEGMEHFVDCKFLFILDLVIVAITLSILAFYFIFHKKFKIEPERLGNHSIGYWASIGIVVCFSIIALLAATNFDLAFETFHHIFFPGKTNWIFYPSRDEIIKVLPEVFFANCAILIFAIIVVLCATLIKRDLLKQADNFI